MDPIEKQKLIDRFLQANISPEEEKQLEDLIESGDIPLEALTPLQEIHDQLDFLAEAPDVAPEMSPEVWKAGQVSQAPADGSTRPMAAVPTYFWLIGVGLLFIGLLIGWLLKPATSSEEQLDSMQQEIIAMKELMMLNMLEKKSSSERLKAVSLSKDLDQTSEKVTNALIQTLRNDENVNVRLAALDALTPFAHLAPIRIELVRSIKDQQSPLVLMSLAEIMVALQEKRSIEPLQEILQTEKLPEEIRQRLKGSIEVLL
ncbi:MAG: HEAT repeat domain-containing protein [Bacteroidota bacterium]